MHFGYIAALTRINSNGTQRREKYSMPLLSPRYSSLFLFGNLFKMTAALECCLFHFSRQFNSPEISSKIKKTLAAG